MPSCSTCAGCRMSWITRLGLPLFPRIEDDAKVAIQREGGPKRIAGGAETAPQEDEKEQISFQGISENGFARGPGAGEAERIPKSKNLLKLTVSLGEETRTVVAGLAKHYAPEELAGPQGDTGGQPRAREAHGRGVAGDGPRRRGWRETHARWTWMKRCRRARRLG